jgi:carboxymethylenebutenolidase
MGQDITIDGRDGSFGGYLAKPVSGKGPGIVVIQEIFGINDVMRQLTDRLAAEGFVALAPDLFWRLKPGIQLTDKTDAEWKEALDLMGRFDVDKGVEDIQAAITHLRALSSGKVGAVGYCLGGLLAYLTAARTDSDASVGYYGVNIPKYLDEAANIKKPLLLHIAMEDGFVPKEAQAKIRSALKDYPSVTTCAYAGVDHAFARPGGKNFDATAAGLANSRTDAFFREHLP